VISLGIKPNKKVT